MPKLPSKRLYLRNLPEHVGEGGLHKHLSSYGKIVEVKIVHDYAFVEFESQKDAQDVLETFQKEPFLGQHLTIEYSRPLRKDTPSFASSQSTDASDFKGRVVRPYIQCRYPVVVSNIPNKIRWQELKDFGRLSGGLVAYCDLDKKKRGRGFIEYFSREEAEQAIKELDGRRLGGKPVKVTGRPEVFSRGRSRSLSPEPRSVGRHPWTPDKFRNSRPAVPYSSSNTYSRRYHISPPPAYHSELPPPHSYSQPRSVSRHESPFRSSDDRDPSVHHLPYPVQPYVERYDEQYDYASHTATLDAWKYDYDYDNGHEYCRNPDHQPSRHDQGLPDAQKADYHYHN